MTDVKIAALNGEKETNIIMKTIEIFRIFERKLLEWMCPLYQASPVPVNYWAAQPEVGGDDKQNFICVYKCSPLLTFPLPIHGTIVLTKSVPGAEMLGTTALYV